MSHFKILIYGESNLSHDEIGERLCKVAEYIEKEVDAEVSLSYSPTDEQCEPIKDRLNEETERAVKNSFDHPESGLKFDSVDDFRKWLETLPEN